MTNSTLSTTSKIVCRSAIRRLLVMLGISLCGLTLTNHSGSAQVFTPEAGGSEIVQEIEIQFTVDSAISRERILANMGTRVGQPFSADQVTRDTENLIQSGLVRNVRIFRETLPDGVKVVVIVDPSANIGEITISGAEQLSERRLRRELEIEVGDALDDAAVEESRQKLEDLYIGRGFADTEITTNIAPIEGTGNVRVNFNVLESGRQVVKEIVFEGNTAFSDKELTEVMETKKRGLFSIFGGAGRLEDDKLQNDLVRIRQFYQDAGYIDAQVGPVRKESLGGRNVRLIIEIQEGGTYTIGSMTFEGNELITEDQIRALFTQSEGQTFTQKAFREDIEALRDFYGSQGYVDANIAAELKPGGPGVIDLDYFITEGLQAYVGRVNISGNTKTQDKVLRRLLGVAPGEIYDTVKVNASRRRLEQTGYFGKVEIFPSDTLEEGVKDVNVDVEERFTGSLQVGAGFSSVDQLVGFAEIQQSNFDITNWPNFTGGGQRFRIRVQVGNERSDFIATFTEPWFLDRQLELSTEGYFRSATFLSDEYDQRQYGGSIGFRFSLGDRLRTEAAGASWLDFTEIGIRYRLENIEIFDVDDDASEIIQAEEGEFLRSQISGNFIYDTRDDRFLPRRGERIEFGARIAGEFLGGDVNIYGWGVEGTKWWNLPGDLIFLVESEVAFVDSIGGDNVPIFDRLFLGGPNDLRGFDFRDVGPKDETGEPIGGLSLWRATTELTFPILRRVRGALFFDVGGIGDDVYNFGDVNSNVGLGVRLDLPIGPVRIDVGFPLETDEFNDTDAQFNFNVGYRF